MEYNKSKNIGMELLIQQYSNEFETDENINHYSWKDFLKARRKYLKYMLEGSINRSASQLY